MKLTDNQRRYIESEIKRIDGILAYKPREGYFGLELKKRYLQLWIWIDEHEQPALPVRQWPPQEDAVVERHAVREFGRWRNPRSFRHGLRAMPPNMGMAR